MATEDFFRESTEQSQIKTRIVSKYFAAWAQVIVPATRRKRGDRVAFIDLFAGPGRYSDELPSTPLRVLGSAVKNPALKEMLVPIFNDVDPEHVRSLKETIQSTPKFDEFVHKPQVFNYQVGDRIVDQLEEIKLVPTLLFVDPWGYKGLSLRLINSVLRNWGSDCIFFFNYNRINSGISNEAVEKHMDALFGVERARNLRARLPGLRGRDREQTILGEIAEAFKETGGEYFLAFRFWKETERRISHHLIFVSKEFRGYHIMKDIMAKESSSADQGVPSLEYNPRDYTLRLELSRPLDELEGQLLHDLAGRTYTLPEIYKEHSVGRPFVEKNYRQALKNLEAREEIEVYSPKKRPKGTFAPHVQIIFPSVVT